MKTYRYQGELLSEADAIAAIRRDYGAFVHIGEWQYKPLNIDDGPLKVGERASRWEVMWPVEISCEMG